MNTVRNTPDPHTPPLSAEDLAKAMDRPWIFGFMPLLRRLAAKKQHEPPIGEAQRPQQESFRLGQLADLGFATREIADIHMYADKLYIRLFSLGMLGPNGPLPLHYTELVRDRINAKQDNTLADFLDIFHHRALTHTFRAWAQAQSAAGLDRPDDEHFTPYIARLAGDESGEIINSPLPNHARWASVAHRIRQSRNVEGLESTLRRFFSVPITLHEYQLHWISVEGDEATRLGYPCPSSILGQGAIAGEKIPDRQSRFRLVIGPLTLAQYLRFTPGGSPEGKDLPALIEWVRAFIGYEFEWEVQLLIKSHSAAPAQLGEYVRLGVSSWMMDDTTNTDQTKVTLGMLFDPEDYADCAKS